MNVKTLQEIGDYIWANEPACRKWPKDKFDKFVAWHFGEGFVLVVLDFDESIAGVALMRPVMEPMDALDPMKFDQEGSCLHVSQVCCTAKGALSALGFAALKRFGMRRWVSWSRPPEYKLEVHEATALRRNLFRMTGVYK